MTLLIPIANCNLLPDEWMPCYSGDVDEALAAYRRRYGREAETAYCYQNKLMRLTFVWYTVGAEGDVR